LVGGGGVRGGKKNVWLERTSAMRKNKQARYT
jgi:hypothetical protein